MGRKIGDVLILMHGKLGQCLMVCLLCAFKHIVHIGHIVFLLLFSKKNYVSYVNYVFKNIMPSRRAPLFPLRRLGGSGGLSV